MENDKTGIGGSEFVHILYSMFQGLILRYQQIQTEQLVKFADDAWDDHLEQPLQRDDPSIERRSMQYDGRVKTAHLSARNFTRH